MSQYTGRVITNNALIAAGMFNGAPRSEYGTLPITTTYGNINTSSGTGTTQTFVYRGRLNGQYVYSNNTPPGGGATDICLVGIF